MPSDAAPADERRRRLIAHLEERAGREAVAPLSYAQEQVWFFEELGAGSPFYNQPLALRLRGPLDAGALERALREIVRRHESLRTGFETAAGRVLQRVAPAAELPLERAEIQGATRAAREEALRAWSAAEARRPFALACPPLARAHLARLGPREHVLLLVTHHLVTDGWSAAVVLRELEALYPALASAAGPSALPALPALPVQYRDWARWQRRRVESGALEGTLGHWVRALAGAPEVLELPTDRPRPRERRYEGARHPVVLPAPLVHALRALGRAEGASLFMTLLAGWAALLHRYTGPGGAAELVLGVPLAGRLQPQTEALVGFFANTVALRLAVDAREPFRALLARVRRACLDAYAHQELPLGKLVEALRPTRDASRAALFQVLFEYHDFALGSGRLGDGVRAEPYDVDTGTAKFDLTLTLGDGGADAEGEVRGALEYSTELFAPETAERMVAHLHALLHGAAADPEQAVGALPLLGADERRTLVETWNATDAPYPEACVHRLFEAQAARTPDAVAVEDADGARLSYRALDARANRLAHRLRALGVGRESAVGVCLGRGVEAVVALLGVLKAGGAYLPLDPAYPAARLAFMLHDARVDVLLTDDPPRVELAGYGGRVVRLPAADARDEYPATRPPGDAHPDDLLYVIYTSGSTGLPKGTCLAHRPLVNLLHWYERTLRPAERTLQYSPLSFDASFHEIFLPLVAGKTVVLMPERLQADFEGLAAFLAERVVDKVTLPAVALEHLAQACVRTGTSLPALREVISTAEQLTVTPAIREFFRRQGGTVLHDHYGPSETHVVTAHTLRGDPAAWPTHVPIGRPIANTRIHLLDDRGEPVPRGVTGELYVGGVCLARGYLHRPELTAERFVESPWAGRLYRTGDLARHLPDGTLVFLGRRDAQVKLRGHRVELGEVEAALAEHPAVLEAVAAVREDAAGEPRLVAYVRPAPHRAVDGGELRGFLAARLPRHMLPAAFVPVDAIPLGPSGKVDRRALPAPDAAPDVGRSRVGRGLGAPAGPVEEIVAGIWAEALGVGAVGVEDDFFALGGHSLLATRVVTRVREALAVDLPLRVLFERPSVRGLADALRAAGASGAGGQLGTSACDAPVPPRLAPGTDAPLSAAQERLWLVERLLPGTPLHNLPFALRLEGALDAAALRRALEAIVRRHHALRTAFVEVDGEPVQRVAPAPAVPLPCVDLAALPAGERAAELARVARREARTPFDLARAPLLRATLVRLGAAEHVLLLVAHHLVADGGSIHVLYRELEREYDAALDGRPTGEDGEPPVQYPELAAWERERLRGPARDAQLAYWAGQLGGRLEPPRLPADRPRPAERSYRLDRVAFSLPPDLSDALGAASRREGVTLFMQLLALFATVLHRRGGQTDVRVGALVSGRDGPVTAGVIGLLLNTVVLRTDVAGDPTFRELLGRVRATTLGAFANRDVPFEWVVAELERRREDFDREALFGAMLVFETEPAPPALRGVRTAHARDVIAAIPRAAALTTLDLVLSVRVGPEGVAGQLEYDPDVVEEATALGVLAELERAAAHFVADPERRISTWMVDGGRAAV